MDLADSGIPLPESPEKPADALNRADVSPLPLCGSPSPGPAAVAQDGVGKGSTATVRQGLETGGVQPGNRPVTGEPVKERRGRRYKTFESIRRGLASVANQVEQGTMDPRTAAVAVQALNGLLAAVDKLKAAEIDEQAERIEQGGSVGLS